MGAILALCSVVLSTRPARSTLTRAERLARKHILEAADFMIRRLRAEQRRS